MYRRENLLIILSTKTIKKKRHPIMPYCDKRDVQNYLTKMFK